MAFVIRKKETFVWPVKIKSPADGGKYDTQTIDLEFKKVKQKEITEALGVTDNSEFCKKIVIGWRDVKDASGAELCFDSCFEDFLQEPGVAKQIVDQYLTALAGAMEKN